MREGYSWATFKADCLAGLTVATIALPLALALAIASGTTPERGLFTAIVAGFLTSLFGGSRFQIGGPTGAFVIVIFNVIQHYGYEGLVIVTLMAGIILIITGAVGLGSIIRYIPHPVIFGFTAGIGILIMAGQIKDFLGLSCDVPAEFIDKMHVFGTHIHQTSLPSFFLAFFTLVLIIYLKQSWPKIPAFIVAIASGTIIALVFHLDIQTIQSRFGVIPSSLVWPSLPTLSFSTLGNLLPASFTIAFLAGIESLLSATIADSMTGTRHRPNCELIAQGIANIGSVIFGGIPATGALARTAANIRSGAKTPISGMMHAVFLFLFMKLFAPIAVWIPLCVLASTLLIVAWNMIEYDHVVHLFKTSHSDTIVFLITFVLTLISDVTVAVAVGGLVAVLLFTQRMITYTEEQYTHKEFSETEEDAAFIQTQAPEHIRIVYLSGPFFFGVTALFNDVFKTTKISPKVIILDLSAVPFVDATGFQTLKSFIQTSHQTNIHVLVAGIKDKKKIKLFTYLFSTVLETENPESYIFTTKEKALTRAMQLRGNVFDGARIDRNSSIFHSTQPLDSSRPVRHE